MARGKYGTKADGRLRVLESEAVRDAHAKIRDLQQQLTDTQNQLAVAQKQSHSQAMQAAAALSSKEKQHLRNQLASLQHQDAENRLRYALLTWEIMHRERFNEPSPPRIQSDTTPDSYNYWINVHWEIAALFFNDHDDIWKFFELVQGYKWRMVGDDKLSLRAGDVGHRQTSRQNTRALLKGGIKASMMRRVHDMRAYYDRIWEARQSGGTVPVLHFRDAHAEDRTAEDRREEIVDKLKTRG